MDGKNVVERRLLNVDTGAFLTEYRSTTSFFWSLDKGSTQPGDTTEIDFYPTMTDIGRVVLIGISCHYFPLRRSPVSNQIEIKD